MQGNRHLIWLVVLAALLAVSCAQPDPPTINLYRAIHAGDLDQIKRHIAYGADLNQKDPDGKMPLHVAAERGRLVIAQLLVENGAQLEAQTPQGLSALELSVIAGKTSVAKLLLSRGAQIDAQGLLFKVIRHNANFRNIFDFLVKQGADINAADDAGNTPLIVAIEEGYRLPAKRLIELGADVNLPAADGRTPLSAAKHIGNQDISLILKRYGAEEAP
jgi:hypothetical protein